MLKAARRNRKGSHNTHSYSMQTYTELLETGLGWELLHFKSSATSPDCLLDINPTCSNNRLLLAYAS